LRYQQILIFLETALCKFFSPRIAARLPDMMVVSLLHIKGIFSRILWKNSLEHIKMLQEFALFTYSIQESILKKELFFH
jgi:hypothetical protein